jgi:hypothetical protein
MAVIESLPLRHNFTFCYLQYALPTDYQIPIIYLRAVLSSGGIWQLLSIGRSAKAKPGAIKRSISVVGALASVGLFVESADRRFKLTSMGKLLQSDHPESFAGYARFVAHDSTWRPLGTAWL